MAKKALRGKIIACIDIGSSKLMCIIASIERENIRILGYSHKESRGIRAGAISDMKLAQKSITNVVSEAEKMAGINIERLVVSISGSQIKSTRIKESIKIASTTVRQSDISMLASKVRAQFRKKNREMIHLIPLQYNIDDSCVVQNPRYMSGEKLFARFHGATTSKTTILNIENCLKRCQLSVNNYIAEPYASSLACLNSNEMNAGTLLIDFGGDVTSFSIILEGKLIYVNSVNIGGNHITKDISTILGIGFGAAEKIKNLNSSLLISSIEKKELIKFDGSDIKNDAIIKLTKSELCEIIKCRIEEILETAKKTILDDKIPDFLINNIVLTGGVCQTIGVDKVCEEIFSKPSRIALPSQIKDIDLELELPSYSCALGMMVFSKNLLMREKIKNGFEVKVGWLRGLIEKIVAI